RPRPPPSARCRSPRGCVSVPVPPLVLPCVGRDGRGRQKVPHPSVGHPLRKYTLLALRAGRWSAAPFPLGISPTGSPPRAPSGVVPGAPAVSSAPHHQRDAGRDDDRPEDAPQRIPLAEQPPAQQRPDHDRGLPDRGPSAAGGGGRAYRAGVEASGGGTATTMTCLVSSAQVGASWSRRRSTHGSISSDCAVEASPK